MSTEDIELIKSMKKAAVSYVCGQTGLSETDIDKYEDITIAVLTVISDMWDNRSLAIDRSTPNDLVDNILFMHSENLLASAEVK